jgi:hypothetical protein
MIRDMMNPWAAMEKSPDADFPPRCGRKSGRDPACKRHGQGNASAFLPIENQKER